MTLLTKLLAGSAYRRTRLHDERGNIVPLSRALRNGPRALATGLARLVFSKRPERPWISYDAQQVIARHLDRSSRVLEFGSGMSTIWYARRAGRVTSVEDDRAWFEMIRGRLAGEGNVDYRLAGSPDDYLDVPRIKYDLIMIDGRYRDRCVEAVLPLLAERGMIYLDNSDRCVAGTSGDIPAARAALQAFASDRRLTVRYFTDFAPTQLFVQQGMLVGPAA